MNCYHCDSSNGVYDCWILACGELMLFELSCNFLVSVLSMSWAWVTAMPSSVSRNWISWGIWRHLCICLFLTLQMLVFVDLLVIYSSSKIVLYLFQLICGNWRVSFWFVGSFLLYWMSDDSLAQQFSFFVPPRCRTFLDILQSGNSKGFVCGWDCNLLKFVFCFVNLAWAKFMSCFFLGALKRYVFLIYCSCSYFPLWLVVTLSCGDIISISDFCGKWSHSHKFFNIGI